MCTKCRLTTPSGPHEVCYACAVALRAEAREGLSDLEDYLASWSLLQRWLGDEE